MKSVEFCQDGLSMRVSQDDRSDQLLLSLDREGSPGEARFRCSFDDLLATSLGLTFQVVNDTGHIMIVPEGPQIKIQFTSTAAGSSGCLLGRSEFAEKLAVLRPESV